MEDVRLDQIRVGDVVCYDSERDGEFWNIKSILGTHKYVVTAVMSHSCRLQGVSDGRRPLYYNGEEATISPYWLRKDNFMTAAYRACRQAELARTAPTSEDAVRQGQGEEACILHPGLPIGN